MANSILQQNNVILHVISLSWVLVYPGLCYTVSVIWQDKGYTVIYSPLPKEFFEGEGWGNFWGQRIYYIISYIILLIIRPLIMADAWVVWLEGDMWQRHSWAPGYKTPKHKGFPNILYIPLPHCTALHSTADCTQMSVSPLSLGMFLVLGNLGWLVDW